MLSISTKIHSVIQVALITKQYCLWVQHWHRCGVSQSQTAYNCMGWEPHLTFASCDALSTYYHGHSGSQLLCSKTAAKYVTFPSRTEWPYGCAMRCSNCTQYFEYLLALNEVPATCAVLIPFACTYKAKPSCSCGSHQPITVEGAAWSRQLGRDFMPKDLLNSSAYARSQAVLILQKDNIFHSCTPEPYNTALPYYRRSSSACHSSQCSLCPNSRPSPWSPCRP